MRFMYPGAAAYAEAVDRLARAAYEGYALATDVAYGPDPRQRLDVFAPKNAPGGSAKRPVVAFIHGGGWVNGDKRWMAFMAATVTALPAVFVSVGYRLAPGHRWPAPAHDCRDALATIAARAGEWNADPRSIVLGGHSAGAHLAAWVAAHPPAGVRLRLCAPVSGSFDLRFRDVQPGSMEERVQKNLFARPQDEVDASPSLALDAGAPPFFVAWGDADLPRTCAQGPRLAERLATLGVPCATHVFPGTDHFAANMRCADPEGPWIRGLALALSGGLRA